MNLNEKTEQLKTELLNKHGINYEDLKNITDQWVDSKFITFREFIHQKKADNDFKEAALILENDLEPAFNPADGKEYWK